MFDTKFKQENWWRRKMSNLVKDSSSKNRKKLAHVTRLWDDVDGNINKVKALPKANLKRRRKKARDNMLQLRKPHFS